jgi:Protein of unknwon function (DUF3310)
MAMKFTNPNSTVIQQASPPKSEEPKDSGFEPATVVTPTPPARQTPISQPVQREIGRRKEMVNHPEHYGGKDNPYEAIKVIRAWNLSFSLGNVIKYVSRAGKKDPLKRLEDLHKAMWYLQEEIASEYEKSIK